MADSEIAGLSEDTTPDSTDNVYAQDAAGAVDKRVPFSAFPVSTAAQTAIDAKVADAINNGTTTVAPSQNAVFDALALKADITGSATVSSGAGAPVSTPTKAGDIYIDTTGDRAYIATDTASSADWDLIPITAAQVLALLVTVDGAGSGLDADLLDGQSSAYYATASSVTDHTGDTSAAHAASAISADSTTLVGVGTDVQAVLEELDNGIADHLADATAAHAASAISFTPNGSIAATDVQAAIQEVRDEAAGGGAPSTSDYLVGTTDGGLSNEIVVGTSPGGELGGTWASPTVDATHSGSSHASVQSAAEATAAADVTARAAVVTSGAGAPASTPAKVGNIYIDTTGDRAYIATDTASSADWDLIPITAAQVLALLVTVDGAGSGLDADLLDGQSSAFYATATSVSDHLADTSAAHAASAVSADSTTLVGTGTDVQAVLEELDNGIADHLADTSAAHAASAISYGGGTGMAATDVEAAIDELANEKVNNTGNETIAGVKTFSSDPIIPDEAYNATNWNGVLEPPTKNAVRDQFESLATFGYGFDLVTRSGFADADTVDIQEFTSSGTWSKPDGARIVLAILIGGGGGGAGGVRNVEGQSRPGGGGGGAGGFARHWLEAADLDATEAVTIGAAGSAGAGVSTNTVGGAGGDGGDTILDTIAGDVRALGGGGGSHGGGFTPGAGGDGPSGGDGGYAVVGSSITDVWFQRGKPPGGGGCGMSRSAANADQGGSNGGDTSVAGGARGSPGGAGTAGANGEPGSGGGGGNAVSQAGGAGGAYGGGGGGGAYGNGTTPNNSGAGGAGGAGYALIVTFL